MINNFNQNQHNKYSISQNSNSNLSKFSLKNRTRKLITKPDDKIKNNYSIESLTHANRIAFQAFQTSQLKRPNISNEEEKLKGKSYNLIDRHSKSKITSFNNNLGSTQIVRFPVQNQESYLNQPQKNNINYTRNLNAILKTQTSQCSRRFMEGHQSKQPSFGSNDLDYKQMRQTWQENGSQTPVKYSLRNNLIKRISKRSQTNNPNSVYICLKYQDLAHQIHLADKEASSLDNQNQLTPAIDIATLPNKHRHNGTWSKGFTKYFCNTFNITQNNNQGCNCQPKCYWIDHWLNIATKVQSQNIFTKKYYQFDDFGVVDFLSQQQQSLKSRSRLSYFQEPTKNTNSTENYELSQVHSRKIALSSNGEENVLKQIEKDIPRTQSDHQTFQNLVYLDKLREVLVYYSRKDQQVGYVQGMNIIASVLIYHSRSNYESIRVMQFLMKKLQYRNIYKAGLQFCKSQAQKTVIEIKKNAFDLYNYIVIQHQIDLAMFISSWYFSMLGSFVPLNQMHFIIDKFIRRQFIGIIEIIVTLIIYLRPLILSQDQQHEIMIIFSNQQLTKLSLNIDWQLLVYRSDNLQLKPIKLH